VKLKRALIRNFKGVREVEIDFTRDDGSLRPLTALVGDNGSGKTTVLQAIALTLSLATKQTEHTFSFRWPGFYTDRIASLGPTRVELDVAFTPKELDTVRELHHARYPGDTGRHPLLAGLGDEAMPGSDAAVGLWHLPPPGNLANVTLVFEGGQVSSPNGRAALSQFGGWDALRDLDAKQTAFQSRRADVGGVFWFTQLRSLAETLSEAAAVRASGRTILGDRLTSWNYNVGQLRHALMQWWSHHKSEIRNGTPDLIEELQRRLGPLFPGTRFLGPLPRSPEAGADPMGWHFFIERNGRRYDIAEMSSGEQAVFPLLWAFVHLRITHSVVLIDELELHLHPPEQQALLTSLRKIGPDCQFIITTHSPYLTEALSEREIVRLEDGRVCR
jgi:predicted ATPase